MSKYNTMNKLKYENQVYQYMYGIISSACLYMNNILIICALVYLYIDVHACTSIYN